MSIRLKGNGLWASSRMFLPEHKERNQRHTNELDLKKMPTLDEQKQEEIGRMLQEAYEGRREITLVLFNPNHRYAITGYIEKVDHLNQHLLIGGKRIYLANIVDCEQ